jgi:hypothetical protein
MTPDNKIYYSQLLFLLSSFIIGLQFPCSCQNTSNTQSDIHNIKFRQIIRFDSLDFDTFYINIPLNCDDILPNFIRPKSKKNDFSKINGINFIEFTVDSCDFHGATREKKTFGYSNRKEDSTHALVIPITYCRKDTIYYSGDTLVFFSNIIDECCVSYIAEIELKDNSLILLYKTYNYFYAECSCHYGLNYKILISGDKPKTIELKKE